MLYWKYQPSWKSTDRSLNIIEYVIGLFKSNVSHWRDYVYQRKTSSELKGNDAI